MIESILAKLQVYGIFLEDLKDVNCYLDLGERDLFKYLTKDESALITCAAKAYMYQIEGETFSFKKWKELSLGSEYSLPISKLTGFSEKEEVLTLRELRLYRKYNLKKYYKVVDYNNKLISWRRLEAYRLYYQTVGKELPYKENYSPNSIIRATQLFGKVKYPMVVLGEHVYVNNAIFELIYEAFIRGYDLSDWFLLDKTLGAIKYPELNLLKDLKDFVLAFGVELLPEIRRIFIESTSLDEFSKSIFIRNCIAIDDPSFIINLYDKGYPTINCESFLGFDYKFRALKNQNDRDRLKKIFLIVDSEQFARELNTIPANDLSEKIKDLEEQKKAFNFMNKNILNIYSASDVLEMVKNGVTVSDLKELSVREIYGLSQLKGDIKKAISTPNFVNIKPYLIEGFKDLFNNYALAYIDNVDMLKSLHEFGNIYISDEEDKEILNFILTQLENGYDPTAMSKLYQINGVGSFKDIVLNIPKNCTKSMLDSYVQEEMNKLGNESLNSYDLPF